MNTVKVVLLWNCKMQLKNTNSSLFPPYPAFILFKVISVWLDFWWIVILGKNPYPYDFVMSHLLSFHFFCRWCTFFILVLILLVEIWLYMAPLQSCTCWAAILPFFPIYSTSRIFLHCLIYLPIIIFSPKPTLYSIASFI